MIQQPKFLKLTTSISKLPPVDWERIFIRIAILTLALFIIQLLFTAYKYIRTERTKIQNQLMAIFLTNYMDDDKKIDHFSKVIDELSKQSVSFGKVPESIVNSLIKAVGDSSKSFAKKGS